MIENSFYDQNGAIEVQVGYQNALKEAIIHCKIKLCQYQHGIIETKEDPEDKESTVIVEDEKISVMRNDV